MNHFMKKILFILMAVATAVHATEWKTYVNDTVGYSVEYPANPRHIPYKEWAPQGDPNSALQWRYQLFQAEGGRVALEIYTHPTEKTLQEFFTDEIARRTEGKDQANYSLIKDNWFVISGTNARGSEFYHKLFVDEDQDGHWYIDFDFTYPNSEREKYDPICSRLARSFTLLPGEHDH
jgi:hypothetical protein